MVSAKGTIHISSSCDGTLSPSDFCTCAYAFADRWKIFNSSLPQWLWVPSSNQSFIKSHQVEGYLSLANAFIGRCGRYDESGITEPVELNYSDIDEPIDDAILVQRCGNDVYHYDFHVLYSSSYRVPVLYFRAYYSDGQPLMLDEIEKKLPANSAKVLSESKWTFITQEEHPYLNRRWYTLHPCGTSEWMKLLLDTKKMDGGGGGGGGGGSSSVAMDGWAVEQYLVSWLSVVGQVFGLKIPFEMMYRTSS